MGIKETAKSLVAIIGISAISFGLVNGVGTLVPSKYDPFGGEYNRSCAAFRTNKVREIALKKQDGYFNSIYRAVEKAICNK